MNASARSAGKIALVTGAASGIGRACCEVLAEQGALIAVVDRDAAGGAATVSSLPPGARAAFFACDVTDAQAVEAMVAGVAAHFGGLDIAVNNAGIGGAVLPITDYPLSVWNDVIAVNLSSVFYCLRAQIPVMAARGGGGIVNIASIMGTIGSPAISAYVAAKHGVVGLTKVAALECGPMKIRVNAVGPSFIKTPLTMNALPASFWDDAAAMHALERLAEPLEVARLVAFLCSDEASYMTGSLHVVDGGYTAR